MDEKDIRIISYKRGDGYYFCHGLHEPTGITTKPYDGWVYNCLRKKIIEELGNKMADIKIVEGGPAIVGSTNIVTVLPNGEKIENEKVVAICRCGKANVFCDGSHAKTEE